MTDFFFGDLQVNTDTVTAVVTETGVGQNFTNSIHSYNRGTSQVIYPIGMEAPEVTIKFTTKAPTYSALTSKEEELDAELLKQVSQCVPIRIRTDDCPLFLKYKDIFLVIETPEFDNKGDYAGKYLEYSITGRLHGISTLDGGTIDPDDPWNPVYYADAIASQTIASHRIGVA